MFDRYVIGDRRPSHVSSSSNVKVEEHRAPTDQSIELYDEMLSKARKNLVKTYVIENNVINGTLSVFKEVGLDMNYIIVSRFFLNGKEYVVESRESIYSFIRDEKEGFRKLFEDFSKTLFRTLYMDFKEE